MSINDYNIDEQVELIKFAETIIETVRRYGPCDNYEDYDPYISFVEDIEQQVINIRPGIFDQDDE